MSNFKLRLTVLAIVALWPIACAPVVSSCPPVVAYSPAVQQQAAQELDLLPAGSVIERMLSDYAVMRDQARACR